MILNAKNGSLPIADTQMNYISFGRGPKPLILIPGLGDGLRSVKGLALPFAFMYRCLVKDYTVYSFSRRNDLPQGFSTRDMAADIAYAMNELGIEKAHVLGVSQGGMIAEYLAIDFPNLIDKLVLTVTIPSPNETIQTTIQKWKEMANLKDYKSIMVDTAEKSYTEAYLRKMRPMYRFIGGFGAPKSFERFQIMADACVTHDASAELGKITAPTLILGGWQDKIVTGRASEELASLIPGCQLYMYEEYGHGLYEEAPDFVKRVTSFLG